MDKKNKEENEISSVDLWKQVSKQLTSKKSEESSKNTIETMCFDDIKVKIEKITNNRIESYKNETNLDKEECTRDILLLETENSYRNKPIFPILNTVVKAKRVATPSFMPKIQPFMFNDPSFFKKFDLDTLFFIFYHSKGTIHQTYAAIRLKSFAWRFHLRYRIWFQRLDEPKLITPEYEKCEFLFFDYESTWNFMKKTDFVFEYCYLEHNDHY